MLTSCCLLRVYCFFFFVVVFFVFVFFFMCRVVACSIHVVRWLCLGALCWCVGWSEDTQCRRIVVLSCRRVVVSCVVNIRMVRSQVVTDHSLSPSHSLTHSLTRTHSQRSLTHSHHSLTHGRSLTIIHSRSLTHSHAHSHSQLTVARSLGRLLSRSLLASLTSLVNQTWNVHSFTSFLISSSFHVDERSGGVRSTKYEGQ